MLWSRIFTILQWLLAILGGAVCITVAVGFAGNQSPLWPFPGLYLAEIGLTGLLGVASVGVKGARANATLWVVTGMLLAFVVLGGFSLGPFLLPAMIAFLIVAVTKSWREKERVLGRIGLFILAALVQAGVMFAMVALNI